MKFANFEYDRMRGELRLNGERVPLQEQPLRLLGCLLERPGEILGREHIREELWGRMYGDHEHGINTAVRKLRRVLERGNNNDLRIVTSAGRGYRLLLPPGDVETHTRSDGVLECHQELDPEGHDAFLTGRFLFTERTPKALLAAKAHFELACERMPNFALAHASLSRTCRLLTIFDFEAVNPSYLWEQADRHAQRAMQLDSRLSEAQSTMASVLTRYRWRWKEGCAAYERALELDPKDTETRCDYGVSLLAMGRYTEGAHILNRVLILDPRYALGRATVALGRLMQGKTEEGIAILTGMTEAMPGFLTPWIYLGVEQLNLKRWSAAESAFHRALTLAPENPLLLSLLALAYAGQGRSTKVEEIAARSDVLSSMRYISPTSRLLLAMACGDLASALEAVTKTVTERDANFSLFRKVRALDSIRQRPEFLAALRTMNLDEICS